MGSNPVRHGAEWDPEHSRACEDHGHQGSDPDADQTEEAGELHHVRTFADRQGAGVHG